MNSHAGVAELADALRSGRSGRKAIWVQLPASAQTRETGFCFYFDIPRLSSAINSGDPFGNQLAVRRCARGHDRLRRRPRRTDGIPSPV